MLAPRGRAPSLRVVSGTFAATNFLTGRFPETLARVNCRVFQRQLLALPALMITPRMIFDVNCYTGKAHTCLRVEEFA